MMRKITIIIALLFGFCSLAIAAPPDTVQTVGTGAGRMYADWRQWAMQGLDLRPGTGLGKRMVVQFYNDGDTMVSWPACSLARSVGGGNPSYTWLTDDSCRVFWTIPDSERHDGVWPNMEHPGFAVRSDTRPLAIEIDYMTMEGFAIWKDELGTSYSQCIFVSNQTAGANDIRISDCILRGSDSCSICLYANGYNAINLYLWNTILYGANHPTHDGKGIRLDVNKAWVFNCTVFDCPYVGMSCSAGSCWAKNDVVIDCHESTQDMAFFEGDYNCTSDNSAPGSNSIKNKTAYDVFADTTQATLDLHLKTNSVCIDSGTDLSADSDLPFNTDVEGDTRPQGDAWDMGADEWVTAGEGGAVPRVDKVKVLGGTNIR